ncbi:heptaprenyl diphosphate synthase component 1 [Sporosarcina highlanderae]|uniref:Heptaprenyl diphosphate synthase component 1 n=1 Tax=Sporosarcina highlanderae TaxID=3035916 RepID=A0ABT8JUB0_9BACL|nr:heptaprenyl diphosphate synthase component 1 [Sporosarcina highlanderae]MDN4608740.1 heptaprenyl diphosphate synthase component 1 [Sporosarcina highlanderae]
MDRLTINRYIQNYIKQVEQSIQEPIVYRELGTMPLDEAKAFFLLLPFLNGEEWSPVLNISAIAVGAVHAAFDIHDRVDLLDASTKEQQLMVLSGDHFSGIHYRLLSSIPDFEFITAMSKMIGRINETKTDLFMGSFDETYAHIEAVNCIESGCIGEFQQRYGFSKYRTISETALSLIWYFNQLIKDTTIHRSMTTNRLKKEKIETAISILSGRMRKELLNADFLTPFLKQEIHRLANPLSGKPL